MVLLDGKPALGCRIPVSGVRNREVITLEGVASEDGLHPIQKSMMDKRAVQCGCCL